MRAAGPDCGVSTKQAQLVHARQHHSLIFSNSMSGLLLLLLASLVECLKSTVSIHPKLRRESLMWTIHVHLLCLLVSFQTDVFMPYQWLQISSYETSLHFGRLCSHCLPWRRYGYSNNLRKELWFVGSWRHDSFSKALISYTQDAEEYQRIVDKAEKVPPVRWSNGQEIGKGTSRQQTLH